MPRTWGTAAPQQPSGDSAPLSLPRAGAGTSRPGPVGRARALHRPSACQARGPRSWGHSGVKSPGLFPVLVGPPHSGSLLTHWGRGARGTAGSHPPGHRPQLPSRSGLRGGWPVLGTESASAGCCVATSLGTWDRITPHLLATVLVMSGVSPPGQAPRAEGGSQTLSPDAAWEERSAEVGWGREESLEGRKASPSLRTPPASAPPQVEPRGPFRIHQALHTVKCTEEKNGF